MTPEEVGLILAMAGTADQYAPRADSLVLATWHSMLEHVPMESAERTVINHYRATDRTITPYDIADAYRSARQHFLDERDRWQPTQPPEVTHAGVDRALAALAQRKAIGAGEDASKAAMVAIAETALRRDVRSVPCTHCGAQQGAPCVSHSGKPLTQSPAHPSRVAASLTTVGA